MSAVNEFSQELAREIQSRSMFSIDDLSILIGARLKQSIPKILSDYVMKEEAEIVRLSEKMASVVGTREQIATGYKISALRTKVKMMNKAITQERQSKPQEFTATFFDVKSRGLSVNARLTVSVDDNSTNFESNFNVRSQNDIPVIGDRIQVMIGNGGWMVVRQDWMV